MNILRRIQRLLHLRDEIWFQEQFPTSPPMMWRTDRLNAMRRRNRAVLEYNQLKFWWMRERRMWL